MPTVDILFGPYRPDDAMAPMDPRQGPVPTMEAMNVRYGSNGYFMSDGPTQMAATPVTFSSGNLRFADSDAFLNSSSALYSTSDYADTALNDVTATSMNSISSIEYARYADSSGGDWLVCVTNSNHPYYRDLDGSISTDWALIPDTPPIAKRVGVVRDHLILGALGTANSMPNAVQWNSIGVIDDWPTPGSAEALAEEAGRQFLPTELGEVMAIVGMEEFGLVFQERGITRMTYQGGNTVYAFDTFESHQGTMTYNNAVRVGNLVYYHIRDRGFFVTNGYTASKIDSGYVECGSAANVSHRQDLDLITKGAYHPRHNMIVWEGDGGSFDGNKRFVFYSIDTGTFSHWDIPNSGFDSAGESSGDFATGIGQFGKMDLMFVGSVSSVNAIYAFRTRATSFAMTSGWLELAPGKFCSIKSVTPIAHNLSADPSIYVEKVSDYQDLTMETIGGVGSLTSSNTTAPAYTKLGHTTEATTTGSGASARFHYIRISGSATFDKFIGVRVEYEENGAA